MAQEPTKTASVTYADAGVNIDRANRTKQRIKYLAHKTFTKGVLSEIGGFGGLFSVDKTNILTPCWSPASTASEPSLKSLSK